MTHERIIKLDWLPREDDWDQECYTISEIRDPMVVIFLLTDNLIPDDILKHSKSLGDLSLSNPDVWLSFYKMSNDHWLEKALATGMTLDKEIVLEKLK
jgi:hypothetical protein